MSSALLLRFVSRCRSGSAKVEPPFLSDDCANVHPNSFTKVVIGTYSDVGHHGYISFANLT